MNPQFVTLIEEWYANNKRDLPWRHTNDPYRIWVSEVILQQTQVAQGLDYYKRFLEHFPDVQSLAYASEDEVLRQWQGLGYYSRARNMHQAAKQIVEKGFPRTYTDLLSLKGVGEYTAAAIASIAYGLPCAVLDGNVFRVLSRYFGEDMPIDSNSGRRYYRALADEMLDKKRPALYNQAIMDFGALVCTPKAPTCKEGCPLVETCSAFRTGRTTSLPHKEHHTKVRQRHLIYIYLRARGRIVLQKRGTGDIWQGLYQPLLYEDVSINSIQLVKKAIAKGATLTTLKLGQRHQLSHQLIIADFYLLEGWLPKTKKDINNGISKNETITQEAQLLPENAIIINETERNTYAVPRLVEEMYKAIDLSKENL